MPQLVPVSNLPVKILKYYRPHVSGSYGKEKGYGLITDLV